jgi:diguanylate cyclase (GGDEF)-like protein/PAS domain S-box-containing protein
VQFDASRDDFPDVLPDGATLAESLPSYLNDLLQRNQQLQEQLALRTVSEDLARIGEQRLRRIVTNAPVVLFALDVNGVFIFSEGQGLMPVGIEPGGLVGVSVFELFEHTPHFQDDFPRLLAGEDLHPTLEINGIVFECAYSRLLDEQGEVTGLIGVAADITERKRAETRLMQLANFDTLTSLPNRALFHDRLAHALAKAHRSKKMVALLFLDLDRFKTINDSLGHYAGDELLKSVAERLQKNAREDDTVARLGGDEFTVILEGITYNEDATIVARKILEVMGQPFYLDGHEVFVTTSMGIAIYPLDGDNCDDLLKNADTAMYRAKEQGRNGYRFYTADMNAKAVEQLIMESSMRHALERKEFEVYYQPQIDVHSRELTGFEALLRWRHPDLGLLYPNQFLPLAEDNGLIVVIGEWVLHHACAQAALWQRTGLPPVRVAVNLSGRQFRQENLVESVARALHESGLSPHLLELEITENFLLDNIQSAVITLNRLHDLNVQLAMDDFGTGYSSLSYLKRFPLNSLKIDQSFVRDISTDPDDAAIAEAIIALAKTLRLRVIAEGVETEEQLYFLRSRGCDQAQGFLINEAISADQVLPWFRSRNAQRTAFEQKALWPTTTD